MLINKDNDFTRLKRKTLFVLQPIDFCNLNCTYCYLPGRKDPKKMTSEVYTKVIEKITSSPYSKNAIISWHAGEPLTAGLAFYEKVFSLFKEKNKKKHFISQSIQTNGTLINEKWIDLFKKYSVSVCLSMDGPEYIHDKSRVNWGGQGSHRRIQKNIALFKKNSFPLSAICVLTKHSLNYPDQIFSYFLDNGFKKIGFNPEEILSVNQKNTLKFERNENNFILEKYKFFMKRIFDLWFINKDKIYVREFNLTMKRIIWYKHFKFPITRDENSPLNIITIDKNGNLYTFSPELASGVQGDKNIFQVGNIFDIEDFEDIFKNTNFIKIKKAIEKGVNKCMKECSYFNYCGGGAPSNKFFEKGSFECSETLSCKLREQTLTDILNLEKK